MDANRVPGDSGALVVGWLTNRAAGHGAIPLRFLRGLVARLEVGDLLPEVRNGRA
jgi:hypothetical protein